MARGEIRKVCSKCGQPFTKTEKFLKRADADNWEKWAQENIDLCAECYKAEKAKVFANKAIEFSEQFNLPKLEGSEKQIAWAEKIRYGILKEEKPEAIEYLRKAIVGFEESDVKMDVLRAEGKTLADASKMYTDMYKRQVIMLTSTSAKEIIENRE